MRCYPLIISLLSIICGASILVSGLPTASLSGDIALATTPVPYTKETICYNSETGNSWVCGTANCHYDTVAGYVCSGVECTPDLLDRPDVTSCHEKELVQGKENGRAPQTIVNILSDMLQSIQSKTS
jgi:hypothetical protein